MSKNQFTSPRVEVKVGQLWASTDKRRDYIVEVLSVRNSYARVRSFHSAKPTGTAKATRLIALERFGSHNGLKLISRSEAEHRVADALTKDREDMHIEAEARATAPSPTFSAPGTQPFETFSLPAPMMTMPAPAGAEKNVHEEVTAEHPILR